MNAIQTMNTWKDEYDEGTSGSSGSSGGAMTMVDAPSLSGQAREFQSTYTNYGGERYWASFGHDTAASHFLYDTWVYLGSNATDIANLEMDLNQVMPNGQTAIFGFQCDGYSKTWDYTINSGTPENPSDGWVHSTQSCNVQDWSVNTWHHVQILYQRDDAGNVTYQSVWLDGTEQDINGTVPSAFALGWGPSLVTNLQVDGRGASGSSTVYLDETTVYRW